MKDTSTVYLAIGTIAMKRRIQTSTTRFALEAHFMVNLSQERGLTKNGDLVEYDDTLIVDTALGAATNHRVYLFDFEKFWFLECLKFNLSPFLDILDIRDQRFQIRGYASASWYKIHCLSHRKQYDIDVNNMSEIINDRSINLTKLVGYILFQLYKYYIYCDMKENHTHT